jgi:hypothetical protein
MSKLNQWLSQPPADELVAKLNERKAQLVKGLESTKATGEELAETARDVRSLAGMIRQVETLIAAARKAAKSSDD